MAFGGEDSHATAVHVATPLIAHETPTPKLNLESLTCPSPVGSIEVKQKPTINLSFEPPSVSPPPPISTLGEVQRKMRNKNRIKAKSAIQRTSDEVSLET